MRLRKCRAIRKILGSSLRAGICLVLIFLYGCRESILHDLSENEANSLISRLHERQITAEKVRQPDGKWSISVTQSETLRAIHDLEKERYALKDPAEKAEKPSVMSSREEQRFSYERAVSREIEKTLRSIEGVLYSRVHMNLPLSDPVFGAKNQSGGSASVLLVVNSAFRQEKEAVAGIVGGATGIAVTAITVIVNLQQGAETEDVALPAAAVGSRPSSVEWKDRVPSVLKRTVQSTGLVPGLFLIAFGLIIFLRVVRRSRRAISC